jgi:hypothetical protein
LRDDSSGESDDDQTVSDHGPSESTESAEDEDELIEDPNVAQHESSSHTGVDVDPGDGGDEEEGMDQSAHDHPTDGLESSHHNEDLAHFAYRIGGELFIHDADRQMFLESESVYDRFRCSLPSLPPSSV